MQGEGVQQLREALKILAERVLILEHMIGIHGNRDILLIHAPVAIYQVSLNGSEILKEYVFFCLVLPGA